MPWDFLRFVEYHFLHRDTVRSQRQELQTDRLPVDHVSACGTAFILCSVQPLSSIFRGRRVTRGKGVPFLIGNLLSVETSRGNSPVGRCLTNKYSAKTLLKIVDSIKTAGTPSLLWSCPKLDFTTSCGPPFAAKPRRAMYNACIT